jgi:hypothetical protein
LRFVAAIAAALRVLPTALAVALPRPRGGTRHRFEVRLGSIAANGGAVSAAVCAYNATQTLKQMEMKMPIRWSLLSWMFSQPQVAAQQIDLTTGRRAGGRDPLHRAIRWWGSQSPPGMPDGMSRNLLQDIGLDRSRT